MLTCHLLADITPAMCLALFDASQKSSGKHLRHMQNVAQQENLQRHILASAKPRNLATEQEKKRKEKTTPFGVNLMRSQVLYSNPGN